MRARGSIFSDYFFIALTALLTATAVPLYLISVQPDEFTHLGIGQFILVSLAGAFLLSVAGSLAYFALSIAGARRAARFLVYFALFWVVVTGFLLPVVGSAALVDPAKLDENYLNIAIAFVVAASLSRLALSVRLRPIPLVFAGSLLLFSLVPAAPVVYRLHASPALTTEARHAVFGLSPKANLLVISLDGIPGNLADKLIAENAELHAAFRDFYVFGNAVAAAPSTVGSMMGELFGNRNFHELGSRQEPVLAKLDHALIPFNQKSTASTVNVTFGFYNRFNQNPATRLEAGDMSRVGPADTLVEMAMFFEYTVARLASARPVRLLRKLHVTQNALAPLFSRYPGAFAVRLFHHKGPLWDLEHLRHLQDYTALAENLRVEPRLQRYVGYMHFSHTHFPVDLDSHCDYHGDNAEWIAAHQDRAGLEGEALCALRQTARLVERLRTLGVYDNTLLVIKSDHGQPAQYFHEAPDNLHVNHHPLWGYNRYRPLLMVKDRAQHGSAPRVLPDLVSLGDLAQTICLRWQAQTAQCRQLPGMDLLGDRNPAASPFLYLNVVRDETSDYKFDTHKTVRLTRSRSEQDFYALLRGARGVALTESFQAVH